MLAFASLGTSSKKFVAAQNRQAVRLGVLLFFFVPGSAINLVDYYLVKRGRYDVASFFTPTASTAGSSGGRAFAT